MIDSEHKLIFLHIPKCGGTSIEKMLGYTDIDNHKTPYMGQLYEKSDHRTQAELMLLPDWSDYYKFTIIRNPYDRLQSVYKYHNKMGVMFGWYGRGLFNCSFMDFCNHLNNLGTGKHVHTMLMTHFLIDVKAFDKIIKLENIEKGWFEVCTDNDFEIVLKHERQTDRNCLLCPKTCRIIEKVYEKDFELYESIK